MNKTSFTMMGFTQPFAAFPIIKDAQNSVKGFTSRILWMFPKPVFCTMSERRLSETERNLVQQFRTLLVDFLSSIYELGESSYTLCEENKVKIVKVKRREFVLSDDAQQEFDNLHDAWESICERNPHDSLIGGLYSRGKAQVLRLSVPIQLLLEMTNEAQVGNETDIENEDDNDAFEENSQVQHNLTTPSNAVNEDGINDDDVSDDDDEPVLKPLEFHNKPILNVVGGNALSISKSITECSIKQQCLLNEKDPSEDPAQCYAISVAQDPIKALYKVILLTETNIVSFTLLSQRGIFRKSINGQSRRALCKTVSQSIDNLGLGKVDSYVSSGNNASVYFFLKAEPLNPENVEFSLQFSEKLSELSISLPMYKAAYKTDGVVFEKHNEEYQLRKNQPLPTPSPSKRQRKQ